jgi:transcriptional regulator with XRE-family HTH domain
MSIGERLENLIKIKGTNVNQLAIKTNVNPQTIYSIIRRNNTKVDLDVLQAIADELNVTLDYFAKYSDSEDDTPEYYLNDETKAIAQDIYDNPDLRILFDASRDTKPEDLKKIVQMVQIMKGNSDEPA